MRCLTILGAWPSPQYGAFAYVVNYDSTSLISVIRSVSVIETSSNTVVANRSWFHASRCGHHAGRGLRICNQSRHVWRQSRQRLSHRNDSRYCIASHPGRRKSTECGNHTGRDFANASNIGTSGELGTGSVSVIETATNNIATTFAVGKFPQVSPLFQSGHPHQFFR